GGGRRFAAGPRTVRPAGASGPAAGAGTAQRGTVPRLSRRPLHPGGSVRRWIWVGVLVMAIVAMVPLGLNALGTALILDEPLHPADAILVLAGDTPQGDRMLHAVDLYKRGLAPVLVLSGNPIGFRT